MLKNEFLKQNFVTERDFKTDFFIERSFEAENCH
jgi:hypothetical protein